MVNVWWSHDGKLHCYDTLQPKKKELREIIALRKENCKRVWTCWRRSLKIGALQQLVWEFTCRGRYTSQHYTSTWNLANRETRQKSERATKEAWSISQESFYTSACSLGVKWSLDKTHQRNWERNFSGHRGTTGNSISDTVTGDYAKIGHGPLLSWAKELRTFLKLILVRRKLTAP